MPLPISPTPPSEPKRAPAAPEESESEVGLPSLEEVGLPTPPPTALPPLPTAPQPRTASQEERDGWAVDSKTGKRYKRLAANSPEAVRANKASGGKGLTIEQLFQYTHDDPDFDVDDLNGAAETFLAHLRVPPNPEELQELRREREARMRKMEQARVRESLDSEEDV